MISITSTAGLEKRTFPESFKAREDHHQFKSTTPEQQKTPKASPVMEKAGFQKEDKTATTGDNNNLQNLLGAAYSSWPYSETSLIHAINLKLEQEKTKQEYYRLESINRSLELMKHSIAAHVPANLIPIIFAGQNMNSESVEVLVKSKPELQKPLSSSTALQPPQFCSPQRPVNRPSSLSSTTTTTAATATATPSSLHESNPFRNHHARSATISTPTDLRKQQRNHSADDDFSTPPMPTNFKFGGGVNSESATPSSAQQNPPGTQLYTESPLRNQMRHQRALSPAKIGAQAVASLSNRFRNSSLQLPNRHSRTSSLPPQVSIPENSAAKFHKEEKKSPSLPTVNTPIPNKPVILQHQLIQFHHWTPTETDVTPNKRRRSDEGEQKSIDELRDDNMQERRKFITTHARTRSDSSAMYSSGDKSKDINRTTPPKYPNILSDGN